MFSIGDKVVWFNRSGTLSKYVPQYATWEFIPDINDGYKAHYVFESELVKLA